MAPEISVPELAESDRSPYGMKAVGSPQCEPWSSDFTDVLHTELYRFGEARKPDPKKPEKPGTVIGWAHDKRLAGLAFSGGGIRSATFNLGILQALADMDLLRKFHYLSTVSGGGYIGSWLTAWIHRRGGKIDDVARGLRTAWEKQPGGSGPEEIRFLRRFSNYLTPKLGWLGADTWTLVATYLRNVLLNMTALVAAMAFVLMLPRAAGALIVLLTSNSALVGALIVVFFVLLVVAGVSIQKNLSFLQRDSWTGGPLMRGQDGVFHLYPPLPGKWGAEILAKDYKDFILDVHFKLTAAQPSARASIIIRAGPALSGEARRWEIHVGRGETGDIGQQPAMEAQPQSLWTGTPDRMRIICSGKTCRILLNDRLINVFRASQEDPWEGRISLHSNDDGIVEEILLRPVTELPPWFAQQGKGVQLSAVLPLLFAAVISVGLVSQLESLSNLLQVAKWKWLTLGIIAALVMMVGQVAQFLFFDSVKAHLPREQRIRNWFRKIGLRVKQLRLRRVGQAVWTVVALGIGGAIAGFGFLGVNAALGATKVMTNFWPRLVWGPPAFIIAVSVMLIIYVGLRGRDLPEALREWWSRLGAWLLIYALLWIGLFSLALYGPPLLHWMAANLKTALAALGVSWIATTISSLIAAKSSKTGGPNSGGWRGMIATIGPYVFIVGLLAGLAWGIDFAFSSQRPKSSAAVGAPNSSLNVGVTVTGAERPPVEVKVSPKVDRGPTITETLAQHWANMNDAHVNEEWSANRLLVGAVLGTVGVASLFGPAIATTLAAYVINVNAAQLNASWHWSGNGLLVCLLFATAAIALLLCWRVDINEFSMHMMYRNRLARCYLGASNTGLRRPHPFTGFDPNDDIDLASLRQAQWRKEKNGPYPIINCSLNLVGGEELAWQQRMAAPFVFTPEFCGYDFPDLPPGYCKTGPDSQKPEKTGEPERVYASSRGPLTLATAMSISGAAVSPNMGAFSSPATAFLMTLFNVRLGWWIGNPRHERGWLRSSPNWALPWLLAEMFGFTHARGRYIYLSDGGHFENLGILELVRRRCRFIVVCDAEDDHNFEFGGLGNAIEKCRTDLGVAIELDVDPIRCRDEKGYSPWHCAVGRIRYDKSDPDAHAGTLLYIKSSLTGDEPTDVLRYAARNRAFPHETTNDQWFGESQFESYRALGYHAATSAFCAVDEMENLPILTTERLFVELAQRWYPPSSAVDPAFKRRGETLNALYETLRTERNLRFLNQQIYSEWRLLVKNLEKPPQRSDPPVSWLPQTYPEMRAGFYFCNRMIQLMEDVYHDLHLEQEYEHPDNRGWMNLFKHWAWSRMFRVTWTVCAANSGARFQTFCHRHLGLDVGELEWCDSQISMMDIIQNSHSEASLLTAVEWELLRAFLKQYGDLADQARLCLLRIAPEDPSDRKQPSFSAGFVLLRDTVDDEGKTVPRILYFRIRDHLRRMGMGRRGAYRLLYNHLRDHWWKEDFAMIDLDLRPMPDTAFEDDDANSRLFKDLYRGVRLELDGRFFNTADAQIVIQSKESLRNYWSEKTKNPPWYDKEIRCSLSDLWTDKNKANVLHGAWRDASGEESSVEVTFQTLFVWSRVIVRHRFLPNRARRDDMQELWGLALSRLSVEVSKSAATGSTTANQDPPPSDSPSTNA
jgi:hypothetical protein